MQYVTTFIKYNWNPWALIGTGIINTGLFYYKNNIDGTIIHSAPYIWNKQAFPDLASEYRHELERGNDYLLQSCICTGYGGVTSLIPVSFYTIKNHLNIQKIKKLKE